MPPERKELILTALVMLCLPLVGELLLRVGGLQFDPQLYTAEKRRGYGHENDISWLRVFSRPIVYTSGTVLFMLFDQHNAQFIYSQF
jgi:hypothetical protein